MFKGQDDNVEENLTIVSFAKWGGGMLTFRGFNTFIMPLVQYHLTPQEFTKVNR